MDNREHPVDTPGPARPRRSRRWLITLAVVCGVVGVAVALWWPRSTVVKTVEQPSAVSYSDGSAHVAVLRHFRAPAAAAGLSGDHYEVVLGRDPGGDYGHRVRLDATGMNAADLRVDWTPDGAWLAYGSGHRLFVPASAFLGGR